MTRPTPDISPARAMLLAGGAALIGGIAVYALVPRVPLDRQVRHEGFFTTDTDRVLAATVESLRAENRLVVLSVKGTATTSTDRRIFWVLHGGQKLIVPGGIDYTLDLSRLTLADLHFDAARRVVTVRLPPLTMGDVKFQPENATTVNRGLLTLNNDQVDDLQKANYANARRAITAQAQQAGLIDVARAQASADIARDFTVPLRAVGIADVQVVVTFR